MRYTLDGEGLSDDVQGLSGRASLVAALNAAQPQKLLAGASGSQAPTWWEDSRADDFSGMLFIALDLVLPLLAICMLLMVGMMCPRCQPDSEEKARPPPKVLCPDNACRSLTWWDRAKVAEFVRTLASTEKVQLLPPPWSAKSLAELLAAHGVPFEAWGESAKSLLLEELTTGRARLLNKGGKPVRAVELVLIAVDSAGVHGRCLLQEAPGAAARVFDALPELVPATRRKIGESVQAAAKRCLEKKISIPGSALKVQDRPVSITDEMEQSQIFPGIMTLVRKFVVHVEVATVDSIVLEGIGLPAADATVNLGLNGLTYHWVPAEDAATSLTAHLRRATSGDDNRWIPKHGRLTSESYQTLMDNSYTAMLPWSEGYVVETLKNHSVEHPEECFGRGVPELVQDLSAGRYSLGTRKSDGSLVCVQDLFTLLLTTVGGQVLVDASSTLRGGEQSGTVVAKLPCDSKLADEDAWTVARRVAFTQLGIEPQDLGLSEQQALQQVWPGVHALERELRHPGSQPPPRWVLREWIVLSRMPVDCHLPGVVPAPPPSD